MMRFNLGELRAELGLTQEELARQAGVSPNTVARWERGEVAISASTRRLFEIIRAAHHAEKGKLQQEILRILGELGQ